MGKRNIPEIRFKGFDGEWEEKMLKDSSICNIDTGCPFDSKDFKENGKYLVITNGNIQDENSYVNSIDCNSITVDEKSPYLLKKGEILVTMDGTVGRTAIVNDYGMVLAQRVGRLKPTLNGKFLYYLLNTGMFSKTMITIGHGGTIKHISLDEIGSYRFGITKSTDEQSKIADLFTALDKQISVSEAKLDKLRVIKKTLLKKMFAASGEKTPEIRFKGFEGEWEENALNNWIEPSKEKNIENKYSKKDVLSVSGDYGVVNQIEFQGRSFAGVSVSNYGVLHTNDIVYTKSPLKANPYGIIKTNMGQTGIVSTLYAVYKGKDNLDSIFVQEYFELDNRLNTYLRPLVRKGAKNDMKVSSENAIKGNVVFPEKREQTKISELLLTLDKQISIQEQKIEKLRAVKKTLLKKMFV